MTMTADKGGSTEIVTIKLEGVTDYDRYYADIKVLNPKTKAEIAGITIAPVTGEVDNSGIKVSLAPADTNALDVGKYLVVAEVTKINDSVGTAGQIDNTHIAAATINDYDYRKEVSWQLEITKSLINN